MEFKEDKKEKERKGKNTKWVRTHFMSRMFPGEYCTNSVLIRNPHSTHLYISISISISLSALSSQSYTHVLRKGGTGYGRPRHTVFSLETQRHVDPVLYKVLDPKSSLAQLLEYFNQIIRPKWPTGPKIVTI